MNWEIKMMINIGITALLLGGLIGYQVNNLFSSNDDYVMSLGGFYYEGATMKDVENYQEQRDPYGNWISINVRDTDFSEGIEVCYHECGHAIYNEIFAEICEKNLTKCNNIMEAMKNEK